MCFWTTHYYTHCSHSPLYLQDLCSRCHLSPAPSPATAHACPTLMLQPPLTIDDKCPDCQTPLQTSATHPYPLPSAVSPHYTQTLTRNSRPSYSPPNPCATASTTSASPSSRNSSAAGVGLGVFYGPDEPWEYMRAQKQQYLVHLREWGSGMRSGEWSERGSSSAGRRAEEEGASKGERSGGVGRYERREQGSHAETGRYERRQTEQRSHAEAARGKGRKKWAAGAGDCGKSGQGRFGYQGRYAHADHGWDGSGREN